MQQTYKAMVAALALAVVASVGAMAQQQIFFSSGQEAGEVMAYRLGGTRVFNAQGEVIGQLNDIVLDSRGQAKVAVIGLGGVLGLGSKLVGVPFTALRIGPVVESSRVLLLDVTKDQLDKAPAYKGSDPGKGDRAQQKASEWAKKAKETAITLGKQAGEAIQGVRERMNQPTPAAPAGGVAQPPTVQPPVAAPAPAVPAPAAK